MLTDQNNIQISSVRSYVFCIYLSVIQKHSYLQMELANKCFQVANGANPPAGDEEVHMLHMSGAST